MNKSSLQTLQRALVLHTRPYQNTSLLVDFFVENEGVVRCVAKGYRGASAKSRASSKPKLSQFTPLLIRFGGRGELKTLLSAEIDGAPFYLKEKNLFCGLYINELLLRLLYKHDPFTGIYALVLDVFNMLSQCDASVQQEYLLRIFEFSLLRDLGYLSDFSYDYHSESEILPERNYFLEPEHGFRIFPEEASNKAVRFSGNTLLWWSGRIGYLNINDVENFEKSESLRKESKILSRLMLSPYLGDKPLESRKLFEQFSQASKVE